MGVGAACQTRGRLAECEKALGIQCRALEIVEGRAHRSTFALSQLQEVRSTSSNKTSQILTVDVILDSGRKKIRF